MNRPSLLRYDLSANVSAWLAMTTPIFVVVLLFVHFLPKLDFTDGILVGVGGAIWALHALSIWYMAIAKRRGIIFEDRA